MTSILKCKKMIIAEFLSRFEVHSRNWLLYMLDETNDLKKLEKRLKCCKLGLAFFEKMNSVLDGVLADYNAAVLEAEEKYKKLGGGVLEVVDER